MDTYEDYDFNEAPHDNNEKDEILFDCNEIDSGLPLAQINVAQQKAGVVSKPSSLMEYFEVSGLIISQRIDDGEWDVVCPWHIGHKVDKDALELAVFTAMGEAEDLAEKEYRRNHKVITVKKRKGRLTQTEFSTGLRAAISKAKKQAKLVSRQSAKLEAENQAAVYVLPTPDDISGGFRCSNSACRTKHIGLLRKHFNISPMADNAANSAALISAEVLVKPTLEQIHADGKYLTYDDEVDALGFPYSHFNPVGAIVVNDEARNLEWLLAAYGITMRMNEITKKAELDTNWFLGNQDMDAKLTKILDLQRRAGMRLNKDMFNAFMNMIGQDNFYNPVTDYLDALPVWDQETDHIAQFISRCMPQAKDDPLVSSAVRLFLHSACASADGAVRSSCPTKIAKYEYVMVLQGRQGKNKTNLIVDLIPQELKKYVKGGVQLDPNDKDSRMEVTSKWICELGELDSTFGKDIGRLKSFLSEQEDEYRKPFGTAAASYRRVTTFFGTVNDIEFLRDTENRRYLPISVGEIIRASTVDEVDVDMIWGQAWHEYARTGAQWWPTDEEDEMFEEARRDYQIVSEIEELLLTEYPTMSDSVWKGGHTDLPLTKIMDELSISNGGRKFVQADRFKLTKTLNRMSDYVVIDGTRLKRRIIKSGVPRYRVPAVLIPKSVKREAQRGNEIVSRLAKKREKRNEEDEGKPYNPFDDIESLN